MKAQKIITIITIIILILIICLASFLGIYKKEEYSVKNTVPNYILGMELESSRIVNFEVDNTVESTTIYDADGNEITEQEEGVEYTEENGYTIVENKVNSDEVLTQENYNLCKKILTDRLNALGAEQFYIRQNDNGNIQIETTESDNTDEIIYNLQSPGTFELIDSETEEVLLDNSYIKDTNVVYGQTDTQNTVYLQIKFNKEGKQKLEEISKTYISTTTQTTNEDGETQDTETTKNVSILFDGETYNETYFGEPITDGTLNIQIGSSSDAELLNEYVLVANELSAVLNTGVLPITYNVTGYTASAIIGNEEITIAIYVVIILLVALLIYSIIKLKTKGILLMILEIGYISLLLLALRYTNIKLTIEGMMAIVVSAILNYMYLYKAFNNLEDNFIKETTAKFAIKIIPVYIVAVVFTFNSIANISSLGMTLVWGIIMMYLYNLILTQIIVKTIRE